MKNFFKKSVLLILSLLMLFAVCGFISPLRGQVSMQIASADAQGESAYLDITENRFINGSAFTLEFQAESESRIDNYTHQADGFTVTASSNRNNRIYINVRHNI